MIEYVISIVLGWVISFAIVVVLWWMLLKIADVLFEIVEAFYRRRR